MRRYLQQIEVEHFGSISRLVMADLEPGLNTRERGEHIDSVDIARAISWALSTAEGGIAESRALPGSRVRLSFVLTGTDGELVQKQIFTLERRLLPDGAQEFRHEDHICEREIYVAYAYEIRYNATPLIIDELELQRTVSANKRRCRWALDRNFGYAHFDPHLALAQARFSKSKRELLRVREVENLLLLELQQRQKQIQLLPSGVARRTVQAEYKHISDMQKNSASQIQKLEIMTAELLAVVKSCEDGITTQFEYDLARYEVALANLVHNLQLNFMPQLEFENPDNLNTSGLTVMLQESGKAATAVANLPSEQQLFVALLLKIAALCNQEPPWVDLDRLVEVASDTRPLTYRRLMEILAEQRQMVCFKGHDWCSK